MTLPKATYNMELKPVPKDNCIDMKYSHCGYEQQMPEWCYGEEAEFLREEGDPEPPTWQCPKYHNETLVRK